MGENDLTKNEVDITPHPSLISKLGATGYRTYEAIAELIDNSLDARLEKEELNIQVKLDFIKKQIIVRDNAKGMSLETLRKALTLAQTEKKNKNKLGFYGLGLKTACSSLGKKFTIETKSRGEKEKYICTLDEKEWVNAEQDKWKKFIIDSEKANIDEHYTIIKIEELKVSIYRSLVGKFSRIFGIRYYPFLKQGQKINLFVNSIKSIAREPIIDEKTKRKFELELPSGNILLGWGALLTKRRGDEYGFNLYKNGRLIRMHDKTLLGREGHSAISLIIGELYLDQVPTLYNKTDFERETDTFIEIEDNFPEYDKFKELLKDATTPIYQKEISSELIKKIGETNLNWVSKIDKLENETYEFPSVVSKKKEKKLSNIKIKAYGLDVVVGIKLGFLPNAWRFEIRNGKNPEIVINQNSPSFRQIKNKTLFSTMQVAEAVAFYIAKENNLSLDAYQDILRKISTMSALELEKIRKSEPKKSQRNLKKDNEPNLSKNLREMNIFLKKRFSDDSFYFTATSVLQSFLTHIPRINYYFIYCDKGLGEKIQNKLIMEFGSKNLIVLEPKKLDLDYMDNLIKNTTQKKNANVLVIREKEREKIYRKEGSVFPIELALVDLVFEIKNRELPLILSDVEDMISDLSENAELDTNKLHRYAKQRNLDSYFVNILGDEHNRKSI